MRTVVIKVPEDLLAELDAAARRRGAPRSSVVRAALRRFLKGGEKTSGASFAERAAHLLGSLRGGPKDLSHARKHMKAFGR